MARIESANDLKVNFKTDIINPSNNDYWVLVENHNIDYDFKFPMIENHLEDYISNLGAVRILGDFGLKIKDGNFSKAIIIYKGNRQPKNIIFVNCVFNDKVNIQGYSTGVITFSNCTFNKSFDAHNAIIEGKIKFWQCHFKDEANFRNTTFKELVDFWRATFHKPTIFYKTDFLNTVVFSAATFKENVLFTYTRNEKLMLLRGTKAEKGFDFSLAIMPGKLGLFEFNLEDYKDVKYFTDEDEYEKAVSELAIIPIKNKRETFRILKDILESQKNLSESLKYKAIEKDILSEELNMEKFSFGNLLNKINLWLNYLSNNHGNSYGRAFFFTVCCGIFFFYFSLISLERFSISFSPNEWEFNNTFKYFMEFINPIHKFEYLGESTKLSNGFYILDFLGKTFVGYGIYQFIQAFRKYK